jgi:hypothetical protein
VPTLNELFEQHKDVLAGINWADEKARNEAIEVIKTHANGLYMAINNLGFGAAQAKFEKQATDANAAKVAAENALTTERATFQTKIRELEDKSPSVATVNQQWDDKLKEADRNHTTELQKEREKTSRILHQRDQKALETELINRKVPASMAKTLSKDPDLLARFQYDDNGTLSVLQAGQQIPLTPGQGQTHLGLVADEIAATVDNDLKTSNGDRGSAIGAGNLPGRTGGDAEYYEGIRKAAAAEQKGTERVSLAERIKNRG